MKKIKILALSIAIASKVYASPSFDRFVTHKIVTNEEKSENNNGLFSLLPKSYSINGLNTISEDYEEDDEENSDESFAMAIRTSFLYTNTMEYNYFYTVKIANLNNNFVIVGVPFNSLTIEITENFSEDLRVKEPFGEITHSLVNANTGLYFLREEVYNNIINNQYRNRIYMYRNTHNTLEFLLRKDGIATSTNKINMRIFTECLNISGGNYIINELVNEGFLKK